MIWFACYILTIAAANAAIAAFGLIPVGFGLMAPAGTPPDIVNAIQREVAKALNVPAVKDSLLAQGAIPSGNTPQEFAKLIDSELKKWAPVVKVSGAKVD